MVFLLKLKVALPSTTIKLDIALTKVSTVLIVKDKPRITIINDKNSVFSLSNKEKKPRSGITFGSADTATSPLKPINKTIGIIIINATIKLFFKTSLFLAA